MKPTASRTRQPASHLLLTILLLLFGFGILLVGIDSMHMRPDELLTFKNMRFSFSESMLRLATRNNQAHLWWINIWVWQRIAGDSEFAVRMNSILISVMTLSIIHQIGTTWFGSRRYGWFAMLLLGVNSYFFIYSLEMRMYALAMLVTALSMRLFYQWLAKRTRKTAIFYGLSISILLYTHYYLAFIILAQVIYFAIFHILNLKLVRQGFIAALTVLVTWIPGIVILYNQLQFIRFVDKGGLNIPTQPTTSRTISDLAQLASNDWAILYGIIIVAGLLLLWRKPGYRLLLAWLFLSPALVLLVNTRVPVYTQRYTSFFAPAVALAVGVTLAAIPSLWMPVRNPQLPNASSRSHSWNIYTRLRSDQRTGLLVSWLAVILLASISLYRLPEEIPNRLPLRNIFHEMSAVSPPGAVMYLAYEDTDGDDTEHMRRYLAPEILANRKSTLAEAVTARYVWFIANDWSDETIRSQFRQLSQTHRLKTVIGSCTRAWCYLAQLMIAPPLDEPLVFGDTINYLGVDMEQKTNHIEALLWWSVDAVPERDYSISLQLLDSSGALITQLDRQMQPPDFDEPIPTSRMQPGGTYIDWRVLDLPADLPAGEYILQLVVYQWWDNTRLTLADGRDTLPLQSVMIDSQVRR